MRITRTTDEPSGGIINLAPMVDVLFILIIFFITATTFKEEEFDIEVSLPQASGPKTISAAAKLIVINVRKDGKYVLGNRAMGITNLWKIVVNAVRNNPNQKVLIRGDRAAAHGYVADAIAACRQAGIVRTNIGYDYKTLDIK